MPLKIYRRGSIWHYRGTVAGRRLRGSTKTADKETALQIAAEKEQRTWKSHIHGPEAVLTFAQAAILYRQAGKNPRFLPPIEDYWKDTVVRAIKPGAIRQMAMQTYPRAMNSTRNRHIIIPTQAIINHAADMGLCRKISVGRFTVERREKVPATWDWIQAFMEAANPNCGALACFMFLTAARISEALELRWEDVDLAKATALIRQTKIMDERTAHLPPPLVAAMANLPERKAKVFGYASRSTAKIQWNKFIGRAGIEPLSFHSCRHGFATAMLRAGVDVVTIAKLGGWKSPQHVLSTYGHASDDITLTNLIIAASGAQTRAKLLANQ